eukprot:scaffold733_cov267-Pinguiococcus_pyrenoidosus.AAC.9
MARGEVLQDVVEGGIIGEGEGSRLRVGVSLQLLITSEVAQGPSHRGGRCVAPGNEEGHDVPDEASLADRILLFLALLEKLLEHRIGGAGSAPRIANHATYAIVEDLLVLVESIDSIAEERDLPVGKRRERAVAKDAEGGGDTVQLGRRLSKRIQVLAKADQANDVGRGLRHHREHAELLLRGASLLQSAQQTPRDQANLPDVGPQAAIRQAWCEAVHHVLDTFIPSHGTRPCRNELLDVGEIGNQEEAGVQDPEFAGAVLLTPLVKCSRQLGAVQHAQQLSEDRQAAWNLLVLASAGLAPKNPS